MTHRDRHASIVAQCLEVKLPSALTASVAAPAVSADEQPSGSTIMPSAIQSPPSPNAFHSKLRSLMRHPYVYYRSVQRDVIRTVGSCLTLTQGWEIEHGDFVGLALGQPPTPPICKNSDEVPVHDFPHLGQGKAIP